MRGTLCGAAVAVLIAVSPVWATPMPPDQAQYAPYKFLIGDWDVSAASGGPAFAIERFRWGPNKSYIWFSQSMLKNGIEVPHFEGMLMWNGVHKNLDMLLAVDLTYGLGQEQGTVSVASDGSIVREITAVYSEGVQPIGAPRVGPEGATGHFRQLFVPDGAGKIATSAMRETAGGWTPTFPGSDHLILTPRTSS